MNANREVPVHQTDPVDRRLVALLVRSLRAPDNRLSYKVFFKEYMQRGYDLAAMRETSKVVYYPSRRLGNEVIVFPEERQSD